MSDPRIHRADGLDANWPNLAEYIREMADDESEIHDDDDGEAD